MTEASTAPARAPSLRALLLCLIVSIAPPAARAAPATAAAPEVPAGLFFRTDRTDSAVEAPMLETDVRIAVGGLVQRVTVRQRFVNPTRAWVEGIYVFPLPERSAVDRLTMTVGGARIAGEIMERAEARRAYDKAAKAGKRASLLSSERPNVFATSVANIGPGETIVVEIEYQDRVSYADGRFELRFPMVVAPRYTPPGAETPVARGAAPGARPAAVAAGAGRDLFGPVRHPDDGPINPVTLAVALDPGLPIEGLKSLYHPVTVEPAGARRRVVTLADGHVPADRDFVLEWRPAASAAPEAAVFGEERGGDSFLTVMVVPPAAERGGARPPRELVFVIDTSGSMHGPSLDQAKTALLRALDRLGPEDRFNVIRFNHGLYSLFRQARPATRAALLKAARYVEGFEAEGGTEMLPALHRALAGPADRDRLRQVVFLTDGAVGNEAALFTTIAERLGATRLFTVGIGSAPNSYFMRKAAELGRGTFVHIGQVSEVAERMDALLRKLERPVLTDLAVAWPPALADAGAGGPETYPAPLPDLYDREPVAFSARLPGVRLADLAGEVTVSGRAGATRWTRRLALGALPSSPGVAAIWGRAKIDRIEDGRFTGRDPAEVRRDALAVALAHELVTRYTSLVAIDERPARPPEAPLESREVERNLPQGWSYEHVFGAGAANLKTRTLPPDLLRRASAGGTAVGLPQTATPATRRALLGAALLLLALGALWIRRRREAAGA